MVGDNPATPLATLQERTTQVSQLKSQRDDKQKRNGLKGRFGFTTTVYYEKL